MAKFYCRRCGNLAGMVRDSGVPMVCCGQKMEELVPNTYRRSQRGKAPAGRYGGGRRAQRQHRQRGPPHGPRAFHRVGLCRDRNRRPAQGPETGRRAQRDLLPG